MYNICSVRSNGHALFVGTFRPTLVYHLARKKNEQSECNWNFRKYERVVPSFPIMSVWLPVTILNKERKYVIKVLNIVMQFVLKNNVIIFTRDAKHG